MSTHANRVKMTTATTGTGTITLGSASTGFQSFADAFGANATVDILIVDGAAWEIARNCLYTHSGTTLSRGTWEDSSNGTGAITLSGSAVVSVIATAAFGNLLELQLDRATTTITTNGSTTQVNSSGAGTYVVTNLDTQVANPNSWWDGSTNKFTPLRAGTYLIFGSVQSQTNVQCTAAIYKNGSLVLTGPNFATITYIACTVAGLVTANGTTDYFELRVYLSGNATLASDNGLFQAIYIGS